MDLILNRIAAWLVKRERPWERAQALRAAVEFHHGEGTVREVLDTAKTFDTYIRNGGDRWVR